MIALTDDPTIAYNVLLLIVSIYIIVLCAAKVYIKNMNYLLDITCNINLIGIGYIAKGGSEGTSGVMILLGSAVAVFVGIIAYHFYKYIIIVKCRHMKSSRLRPMHFYHRLSHADREPLLEIVAK